MRRLAAGAAVAAALAAPIQAHGYTARAGFAPNDPLAARQWYLGPVRAFDLWAAPPLLAPVRVAIVDTGIDTGHPELAHKIALTRSFVGGGVRDEQGHGTFVAGIVAAELGNAQGIAGIAFPARLLVAKVVRRNRQVPVAAEARAIRWAADNGARVINLSLGGLRDPRDRRRDTFSAVEAAAIRYAYAKGAVIVAAVGNADQAPSAPWRYASYPAALPHVLGVSALGRDGAVPSFSNRDPIFNDVAAPGAAILSTFPRALTAARPACAEQGYSSCGPETYRRGEGTSFAAPQVTAAAALMIAARPTLRPDQVMSLLTRTADDVTAATGCRPCAPGRDALSGWGRLNIARAVAATVAPPAPDRFETNDDAGRGAYRLGGRRQNITATVDFWEDQNDVYGVYLAKGQRLRAALDGPFRANSTLVVWKPGTKSVEGGFSLKLLRNRVAQSSRRGWRQQVRYRAKAAGWHFVHVKVVTPNAGPYRLRYAKS